MEILVLAGVGAHVLGVLIGGVGMAVVGRSVLAAKDSTLAAKDSVLAAKDETLAAKDQNIRRLEVTPFSFNNLFPCQADLAVTNARLAAETNLRPLIEQACMSAAPAHSSATDAVAKVHFIVSYSVCSLTLFFVFGGNVRSVDGASVCPC